MEMMTKIIKNIDSWVWGLPLILLILLCGIWLTFRIRGLQIRRIGLALKFMVTNEEEGEGEVTSFGALCTALSATIGTGNIVGVATAIAAVRVHCSGWRLQPCSVWRPNMPRAFWQSNIVR